MPFPADVWANAEAPLLLVSPGRSAFREASRAPLLLMEEQQMRPHHREHWSFWVGLVTLGTIAVCAVAGIALMKQRDRRTNRGQAAAGATEMTPTNRDSPVARPTSPSREERPRAPSALRTTRTQSDAREERPRAPSALRTTRTASDAREERPRAPSALRQPAASSFNALAEPPPWTSKNSGRKVSKDSFAPSSFAASEAARPSSPLRTIKVTFAELPSSFVSEAAEARRSLQEALDDDFHTFEIGREDSKTPTARKQTLSTWWTQENETAEVDDPSGPEQEEQEEQGSSKRSSKRKQALSDWYAEDSVKSSSRGSDSTQHFDMDSSSQGRKTVVCSGPSVFSMESDEADAQDLPSDIVADALEEVQRKSLTQ